ncbi:unnamed protein product [Trichogramma brassicae]|uniref:Uncharacterized protein n=1 Tax=Trichogramma brassicae TaxID=86971 RepID=A0A6H5J609_9HYME|nr:unnamed protein product [Trichogramma brassicae]
MACSPTSIENQIDSFLEQFQRSEPRSMEEHHHHHHQHHQHHHHQHHQHHHQQCRGGIYDNGSSISRSRSDNLDIEVLEAVGLSSKFLLAFVAYVIFATFVYYPLVKEQILFLSKFLLTLVASSSFASTSYSAPSSLETRSHRSFYCRCVRSPAHERQTTSYAYAGLTCCPTQTRRLLTIIKNQTIDELAAVADELHAVGPSVMATEVGRPRSRPASPGGAASSNLNSVGAQEIAELRAAIVQLTEITREALQRRDQPRGRSRSRTQPRSQSRPRSPTPHRGSTEGYCWYHERYGDVAEQCRGSRVCSHPKARQEN